MRATASPGRCGGFSLLEVLVAFSVLAVTLGVLLQIFSSGLRRAQLAEEYSYAVLVAQSELSKVRTEGLPGIGTHVNTIDRRYRSRLQVALYEGPDGEELAAAAPLAPLRPYQVTVEVIWGERERQRSVALTTVHLYGEVSG